MGQAGSGRTGRTLDETLNQMAPRVEEEVKRIITHLNDQIVPEVRANSSKALRITSQRLAKLAERMEHGNQNTGGR